MKALGILGILLAAAIVLVLMVIVGRSVASASGSGETATVKTGAQKAYEEMEGDDDAPLEDPKETMRETLRDLK